jgi:hypothetical protein
LSLIDDPEHAMKLARAIMSDITLYNGDKIAQSADPKNDLANEIEEGRSLFRARVSPPHHHVFEDAVAAWSPPHGAVAPKAPAPAEEDDLARAVREREARLKQSAESGEAASRARMVMILAVVLIAVAGLTFAFVSHERHHDAPDKHEGHR